MSSYLKIEVNGSFWEGKVGSNITLLDFLRDNVGLFGAKKGCDEGACGACCVLVDDEPICSCLALAVEMDSKRITTLEGLQRNGNLHPLQIAFMKKDAFQCGFCTPGQIMNAIALVSERRNLSLEEVKERMSSNLCRCGCYNRINEAILEYARSSND